MAKRGGFPGGAMPGNMNNLMKQAQKMQQDLLKMQQEMEKAQADVENAFFSATAGGGVVKATVSGKRQLTELSIQPEAVDPEDVEMLQDLVISAVTEAIRQAEEAMEISMQTASYTHLTLPTIYTAYISEDAEPVKKD